MLHHLYSPHLTYYCDNLELEFISFCGTKGWIWDIILAKQVLYHLS
jgi:hypothetical protein